MKEQAIQKIEKELKEFKGGQCENVMKDRCAEVLISFCNQDEEFAQAVVQCNKTFSDALKSVVDKYKSQTRTQGISDLDAFKTLVAFYFPGAGINFSMTIDLCAAVRDNNITVSQSTAPKPNKRDFLNLSLDDLLD